MNKKLEIVISFIGLIAFIIIAVVGYQYLTNNNNNINTNNTNNKKVEGGNVMQITSENFNEEVLQSDKPVIVDFYATWCGPCKMLAPIMEEIAAENPDIKVVKVDVDEQPELSMQYGVSSIPTIVAIKDGETVKTLVGLRSKEDIVNMVK